MLVGFNPQQFAENRTRAKIAAGIPVVKKKNRGSKGTKEAHNRRRSQNRGRKKAVAMGKLPFYTSDLTHPNNREMSLADASNAAVSGTSGGNDGAGASLVEGREAKTRE